MTLQRSLIAIIFIIILSAIIAALVPVQYSSREEIFEIPAGTWQQRMSGNLVNILPDKIYLAMNVRNILVLKNLDEVPQIFGPTLIMPGQSFTLPFYLASDYQFECTAHASGQMTVIVDPEPTAGWQRLSWRIKKMVRYFI